MKTKFNLFPMIFGAEVFIEKIKGTLMMSPASMMVME